MTAFLAPILAFIASLFKAWITKPPAVEPIAKEAGAAEQAAADASARADTEAKIAQAEANAPSSVQGVEGRLDEGTF